jgi:hypothetical protein
MHWMEETIENVHDPNVTTRIALTMFYELRVPVKYHFCNDQKGCR